MIANVYVVKKSKRYDSKGIFATRFIPKGTIDAFWCKKCKFYTKEDLDRLSKKERSFFIDHSVLDVHTGLYTKYCDERQQYDNHSCNANTLTYKGLFSIVVRDIEKKEESTSDYRLYGETMHFKGGCKCGEKNCMKNTTFKPPASKKLQKFWNYELTEAVNTIPYVKQPFKKALLAEHSELGCLFKKHLQK